MKFSAKHTVTVLIFALTLIGGSAVADGWSLFSGNSERGSGDIESVTRELEPINRIHLRSSVDVVVRLGEEQSVVVTGDDNLIENVITEVRRRGRLVVDYDGSYRSRKGLRVEITLPELVGVDIDGSGDVEIIDADQRSIDLEINGSGDLEINGHIEEADLSINGSGDITWDDASAQQVYLSINGSGDVIMEGKSETLEIRSNGSGDVDARRLEAKVVRVDCYGSGDVEVHAVETFDGETNGSGDVHVFGDPKNFYRDENGSGDIRRR